MRAVNCKKCHTAGAEEPDEVRVKSLRRSSLGVLLAQLICERCGHEWETDRNERDLLHLPGYKEAAKHIEESSLPAPRIWR